MEDQTYKEIRELHEEKRKAFFNRPGFQNSNDVAGIEGFVDMQKEEVSSIKEKLEQSNEEYLAKHPELKAMLNIYMVKLLDQRPNDVLTFTGNFFAK